ncbi:MAG TPA: glycosyltransferase family 87 protein [Herpetosiphonaceae bacterium]
MRDRLTKRSWSAILSLCLAALVTLAVLLAAYGFTPPIVRAVSEHDTFVFRDVHGLERAGDFTYRWSTGASTIALPQAGRPPSALLELRLWVPDEQPPVPLTLTANSQPLVTTPIHGRRTLALLVPGAAISSGDPRFGLLSPTWSPPNDPRPLGVGVARVVWHELGWTLPPMRQMLALPGLVLALGLLLLRLGRSPLVTSLSAGMLGVGLALGAALRPLAVAPYTHRLLLMTILGHVALLLWTGLTRPEGRWWALPQRVEPGRLVVLLGVGYWMFLLYQRALCAETVSGVCPRPGTQNIGIVVMALLLALAIVPRVATSTRWKIALVVLALGGVAEAAYAARFAFRRSGPDFFILWRAAYDFHLGRPLYKLDDVLTNHFGHVFKVPPFYGMLFLPFATSDDVFILLLHRLLNVALYLTTGGLLAWLLRPRLGWLLALTTVGVILGLMQPPFDTIAYGQIDIMLLLLLTLALLGLRADRPWLTGLAIALGTLFKLYPFLLVGFLFVRREWKAIGWVAAWLALLNGIAIGVMGWENHVIYVARVLPNIGGGTSWVENQTINGFLNRLSYDPLRTEPIHSLSISLLTYGGFALIAGVSLLLSITPFERRSISFALQLSSFAVVMVLAVPAAWMHYATITILAFVMLVWHSADRPLPLGRAVLLALAFGLIAYGNQWSFFDGKQNPGLPALALSYKFYGLALLWSLMAYTLWRAWALRRSSTTRSAPSGQLISAS